MPASDDGIRVLFTGGRDGYFFRTRRQDGSLLWKIQLRRPTTRMVR